MENICSLEECGKGKHPPYENCFWSEILFFNYYLSICLSVT